MVTLELGNSYSKISGLTPAQEKALRERLSYIVGGTNSIYSAYGPQRKSLLDKKGMFPTGLLERVKDYLVSVRLTAHMVNKRVRPPEYVGKTTEASLGAYPAQIAALRAARLALRGTISMPTGTGKSRVIKMISQSFGLRTLVVVPSLEIKKQMQETLKGLYNVTVENIDSANLQMLNNYNVLIIDEAHHAAAKTYQKLNKTHWTNIYYRFFLTATPFRNDTEETLLFESIAGQVIYQLSYKEAIKASYIVPVEAYYIELPKQKTEAFTYREVYDELVVNNAIRNEILSKLLIKLEDLGVSALCLVREVDHGQLLANTTDIPFISGADDDSRRYIGMFNKTETPVLIGTTGILGEGVDTKPCEYVIIAGLGKAKSQFMQQVGRAVRTFPGKESAKIILIKDKSHKFLTRHYVEQCKILLSEYGVAPVKLEIE